YANEARCASFGLDFFYGAPPKRMYFAREIGGDSQGVGTASSNAMTATLRDGFAACPEPRSRVFFLQSWSGNGLREEHRGHPTCAARTGREAVLRDAAPSC